jgi:hypothetical protein
MALKEKQFGGVFMTALCVLAFASLEGSSSKSTKPTYDDPEGYAALSVLLDRYHSGPKGSVITISPTTVSEDKILSSLSCGKVPDGFQAAAKDFHEKNKIGLQLTAKFSTEAKYEPSNDPDKNLPQPEPGEQELTSRVQTPAYVVSGVGFDPSRTRAIAYVSVFCGEEYGSGGYYFLSKESKGWKEMTGSPACIWISRNRSLLNPQVPA